MSTEKYKKNKTCKVSQKYSVKQALVNYYIIIMFTLFPLFFTYKFYNIRHDKYYFFLILSGALAIAEFLLILSVKLDYSNPTDRQLQNAPPKSKWYKKLSFTDWSVLAFLAVNIISTLFSSNPVSAIYGESQNFPSSGRNSGLLLMIAYVGIYFLITRFFYYFEYIFTAFACASSLVFALAILNSFYIDPLEMFIGLSEEQSLIFISTIGNKNLLSSYICIALPVAIAMAVYTEKTALRVLYLFVSGIGFSALMVADSDSGILGIGVFTVIYFIWYSRRIERLKRYFLTITVMLLSAKFLRLFSFIMNDKSKGMDAFQEIFVYAKISYIFLAAAGIITIALYFLDYKKPGIVLSKAVPIVLLCIFALIVTGIIFTVLYFSCIDTKTDLGKFTTILRFNDKWGTHRGFMWIRSMWIFNDASLMQKLFGTGPDTFFFAFSKYFSDLLKFGDSSTNAAHNEYINYLITIGITGLGTYLAAVVGTIARAVKYAKNNPLVIVCASAVICYSVQAIVNISQPITTPLFIIFMALCEAVSRKTSQYKTNTI